MSRQEQLARLSQIPLFGSFSRRGLSLVLDLSVTRIFEAGTEVVRQGDKGDDLFVIEEGNATVVRNGRKVAELKPGDYFGEIALITACKRNATVLAKTPIKVRVIRRRPFLGLKEKMPDLEKRLLAAMANRLQRLDSTLN